MTDNGLDIGAVLEKLMSSGEAAQLIEKLKANAENTADEPVDKVEPKAEWDSAQLEANLPQVVSAIAPLLENGSFSKANGKGSVQSRNALLTALRPYLNENRRGMIDKIMTLTRLTGIMDMLPRTK